MAQLPDNPNLTGMSITVVGVTQTMVELRVAMNAATAALTRMATAQTEHSSFKFHELRAAREACDAAVGMATMEAYAADVITGKNQKQRDLELDAWLREHEAVQAERQQLNDAEAVVAELDDAARRAESEFRHASQQVRTLQSIMETQFGLLKLVPLEPRPIVTRRLDGDPPPHYDVPDYAQMDMRAAPVPTMTAQARRDNAPPANAGHRGGLYE